jgi:hypothetical protein
LSLQNVRGSWIRARDHFTYLLVQELEISTLFIFDIGLVIWFCLIVPGGIISCPLVFFILIVVCRILEREIILEGFFTILNRDQYIFLVQVSTDTYSW